MIKTETSKSAPSLASDGDSEIFYDVVLARRCPNVSQIPSIIANRLDEGDISPTWLYKPNFNPVAGESFYWVLRNEPDEKLLTILQVVNYAQLMTDGLITGETLLNMRKQTKSVGCLLCSD